MFIKTQFFFWNNTLQREYQVLQKRMELGNEKTFDHDSARMAGLIGSYSKSLKEEMDKVTESVAQILGKKKASKQERSEFNTEEYKFSCILNGDLGKASVRGYVGLNEKPFISISFNGTERRFMDEKSLYQALIDMSEKVKATFLDKKDNV